MHTTQHARRSAPARPCRPNTRRRLTSVALAAALGALATSPLQAADRTWLGADGGNWSSAANWALLGGQRIRPAANDLLVFSAPAGGRSVADLNLAGVGILFQAGAGASTIEGLPAGLGIGAQGITNLSGQRQTLLVGLRAQGQQTWDGGIAGIIYRPGLDAQSFNTPGEGGLVTDGASLNLARNVGVEQSSFAATVGVLGSASLTVQGGSSLQARSLTLGDGSFAQGVLTVRDSTSMASAVTELVVGNLGTGTLTIEGGAQVNNGGHGTLGSLDGLSGQGVATVSGAGSRWTMGQDLLGSSGSLLVADGGQVMASNGIIGGTWPRSADVTVTGAGSQLSFSQWLVIGEGGRGSLSVLDGSLVSTHILAIGATGQVNLFGGTLQMEDGGNSGTADNFVWGAGTLQFTGEQGTRTGEGTFLGQWAMLATGQRLVVDRQLVVDADSSLSLYGGLANVDSLSVLGNVLVSDTSALTVAGVLDNQGTLTVLDGGTVATSHLAIGAGGLLSLQGGTVQVATAANAGTADSLNWYAGTLQYLGSTSTGDGLLLGRSTTLTARHRLVVDGLLTVGLNHELNLAGGSAEVGALQLRGSMSVSAFSTLAVGGDMDNRGLLQLTGGMLVGTGSLVNNAVMGGHGVIAGGGSFINNGLFQSSGGLLELATQGENFNSGSWDMLSGRGLLLSGGKLVNNGAMTLNGDTVSGTAMLINGASGSLSGRGVISAPFFNAGRLVIDAGSLRIDRESFENTGRIVMGSATATLSGGVIYNQGRIEGQGQINNAISNTGTIAALGAGTTLTLAPVDNLNYGGQQVGTLVAGSGATLMLSSGLTDGNLGTIRLAGGTFDGNGTGIVNGSTGVISGFGTLHAGSVLNQGRILLSGGVSEVHADVLNAAASPGVLAGQIILSGNSNTTFYGAVDVQSGAELRVSTGSVATFFGLVQQRTGARFTGAGAKRFEGGVSVGASPGMGRDEGDVEFGDGNHYLAEIGGITACTLACGTDDALKNSSFDKYIVDGSLSLAGTLRLVSWNGFTATAGQHFDLLDWGHLSGQFDSIDASGFKLAAGTQLDFSQLYTTGEVLVTTSAVPEPTTTALWLAGLAGMGWLARRRRGVPGSALG